MPAINIENGEITVAGKTIDLTALPAKSISALLSRGLTHFFGSEQAARVSAAKAKFLEENKREMTEEEVDAAKVERTEIAMKALLEGTIGQRAVGLSVDPLDKVKEQIARKAVSDILRANNIKVPKKDEAVRFADGSEKTMEDMVATRLAKFGDEIEKEAKKVLAARQKQVEAAKAAAAGVETKTADALGL